MEPAQRPIPSPIFLVCNQSLEIMKTKAAIFDGHVEGKQNHKQKKANESFLFKFHQHGRRDVTYKRSISDLKI